MNETRHGTGAGLLISAAAVVLVATTGCTSGGTRADHQKNEIKTELAVIEIAPDLEVIAIDGDRSLGGRSTTSKPLTVSFPEGNHSLSIRLRRDEQEGRMVVLQITTVESDAVEMDGYFRSGRVYRVGYREQASSWQPTIRDVTPQD